MNNILISIIIPVYNVEKYLSKCIESVIHQTYKELEIILVDDGSKDNSGKICDSYAEKDDRIIVVHQSNMGLSAARNKGLDNARGSFIGFVDSDDYVEPTMYEDMLHFALENDCDIVECGVNNVFSSGYINRFFHDSSVLSSFDALVSHLGFEKWKPRSAVWSKLFKHKIIKNKRFPVGKVHEDFMFTCQSFYESNIIGFCGKGLYNHLVDNSGSIMNSKFGKRDLYLEKQFKNRVDYFIEKKEVYLQRLALIQYYVLLIVLFWRCSQNKMYDEADYYLNILKTDYFKIKKLRLPFRFFIQLYLICRYTKLYLFLRNQILRLRCLVSHLGL